MMSALRSALFLFGVGVFFQPGWVAPAEAEGDLSKQKPVTIEVRLGSRDGHLAFKPNALTVETGRLYRLVLINPSSSKHYFTALRFAAAVWTRKVQDANMEVKGAVREIEVLPGKRAEWFFVPVQTGVFDLRCTIAGAHRRGDDRAPHNSLSLVPPASSRRSRADFPGKEACGSTSSASVWFRSIIFAPFPVFPSETPKPA